MPLPFSHLDTIIKYIHNTTLHDCMYMYIPDVQLIKILTTVTVVTVVTTVTVVTVVTTVTVVTVVTTVGVLNMRHSNSASKLTKQKVHFPILRQLTHRYILMLCP